jgi:hypothetical protein
MEDIAGISIATLMYLLLSTLPTTFRDNTLPIQADIHVIHMNHHFIVSESPFSHF